MKGKKKILPVLALALFAGLAGVKLQEDNSRKDFTLLIYMTGSDLESECGAATSDLEEMLQAGLNEDAGDVMILAGGCQSWQRKELRADRINTLTIEEGDLSVLKQERLANMGEAETLRDFIRYGKETFPAREYGLIFWDHGGGAVDGVCLDEWYEDCLTMDEIAAALEEGLSGEKLSFIGFDACLMATAEVALTVSPYADYMVASEEFEPEKGWDYAFLKELGKEENPEGTIPVKAIASYYYDSYPDSEQKSISVLDLSYAREADREINDYFSRLKEVLKEENAIDVFTKLRAELFEFGYINSYYSSSNMVDLVAFLEDCGEKFSPETERLKKVLEKLIIFNASNIPDANGLSIFFPYRGKSGIPLWLEKYETFSFYPRYTDFLYGFHSAVNEKVSAKLAEEISVYDKETDAIIVNTKYRGQIEQIYGMLWYPAPSENSLYLRMGSREGMEIAEDGSLSKAFDGKWFTWQGNILPVECVGNSYASYRFPAMVNGERMQILIETDEDGLPARIAGAIPDSGFSAPSRAIKPIEKGDRLQIIYEADVFIEKESDEQGSGEYEKADYYGEMFTAGDNLVQYSELPPGEYLYGYGFLTYAQDLYLSDFLAVAYEE